MDNISLDFSMPVQAAQTKQITAVEPFDIFCIIVLYILLIAVYYLIKHDKIVLKRKDDALKYMKHLITWFYPLVVAIAFIIQIIVFKTVYGL